MGGGEVDAGHDRQFRDRRRGGAVQVVELEDGCGEGVVGLPAPAGRDVTADQAGGRRCGRDQEDLDPLDRDDHAGNHGRPTRT
ncbi:hypothetical protein ACLQ18_35025 [Streptomyces sp. DT193]|uniref:hypothetical protein n=1 Tax=Streptomyces sp. DT193 TaxID=3393418 RepID=UPI003CF12480